MKIKLLSDLHLEFGSKIEHFLKDTYVLVLAGDIAVGPHNVREALLRFSDVANHVIYLPGNHEFYGYDINCLNGLLLPGNVHLLNPGSVSIKGVTFIGAPLWSNFGGNYEHASICGSRINDFRRIQNFSPDDSIELYNAHSSYIKNMYEQTQGTKVIVTHFLPAQACIAPRFRGPDVLNDYFANHLDDWISHLTDVPYWFFGHTHDSVDVELGEVRLVSNPYGYQYYETNPKFKLVEFTL